MSGAVVRHDETEALLDAEPLHFLRAAWRGLSTRARASTREERARARTPVMEPSFASSAIARTRVRVGSLVAAVGSRGAAVVNREAMRNALAERASMTTINPARDSLIEWEA